MIRNKFGVNMYIFTRSSFKCNSIYVTYLEIDSKDVGI
jgi:hypothetical protein